MSNVEIKPLIAAKRAVFVIGGGISGVTAALELSQLGLAVTLIEKEEKIGGLAADFCCKAAEACKKCFACVVDKRIEDIKKMEGISIFTRAEFAGLTGKQGRYKVSFLQNGKTMETECAAVVLAAGIEPFDAALKGEYGYGQIKNVITARDLERMIRDGDRLSQPSNGALPKKIAFIQCVGSRDQSIGRLYCSQVCCAYALRLINLIRYRYPDIDIAFHYMDIQPAGVHFANFLRRSRQDKKIHFVRSIPSKVYHVSMDDTLRVRYADPEQDEVREELFDMLVLSVGMTISVQTKSVASILGIGCDEDGFLSSTDATRGFFVTGACSGPKDIEHSIIQSKATAINVYQYLQGDL